MPKNLLTDRQMSEAAYVDEAATWSRTLTRWRSRGPGDTDNAMRSIQSVYDIDYWLLWQLRYARDRVKKISAGAYMGLRAAYEAERQRQIRLLHNDIKATEAITGPDSPAVVQAKALVGKAD